MPARATMVKDKFLGAHRAMNRKSDVCMQKLLCIPVGVCLLKEPLVQRSLQSVGIVYEKAKIRQKKTTIKVCLLYLIHREIYKFFE